MGIKVNSGNVQAQLAKAVKKYDDSNAQKVEIGVMDASIAEYAQYVEFGWAQSVTAKQQWWFRGQRIKHPPKAGAALVAQPRPFLRGTLAAEQGKWRETLRKALHKYQNSAAALAVLGAIAVQDVQQTITDGGTSKEKFPERSALTMELLAVQSAKATGKGKGKKKKGVSSKSNSTTTKPLVLSGKLLNSIGFEVK